MSFTFHITQELTSKIEDVNNQAVRDNYFTNLMPYIEAMEQSSFHLR